MSIALPKKAEVVIIGGGIAGCSIAYHLTKRGVKDVVVLERKQLTCGTTWHAAGLVSMLWPTPTLTKLAEYSHELYASLEAETGQATGYKRIGSLSMARTEERMEELRRTASMGAAFGVESEFISNARLQEIYPGINTDGVIGCLYIAKDGQTNPIDTTMALAKGARMGGALIQENTKVEDIIVEHGQAVGVRTDQGTIMANKVVLAGGLWSRDFAQDLGIDLPLYACEHFYVVTEEINDLTPRPVLRDFDKGVYFKEDAGKMLVGWFEHNAKGLPMSRIAEDFCFDQFECDMEHIEEYLMRGLETFPTLGEVGIRTWFNGPESFTADNLHLLGPTPELDNFWVACGMNSKGIGAGGGMGKLMADWIIDGYPSGDITDCDVRRHHPAQRTDDYVQERIPEALGHTYAMHWPFYQYHTARNKQLSPIHQALTDAGACFGEVGAYERPNWFAKPGQKPAYEYSYKRQNWFANYAAEHMAMRNSVGMVDMSSFGKFAVTGKDALASLQHISAADIDVPVGKLVYTQWLNTRGGIEADLTVARMDDERFWVVTGIGSFNRDWWHLNKNLQGSDVQVTNVSQDFACLSVQGPNARKTLQKIADTDISNAGFAFSTGRYANIAGVKCWLQRISYVGELGWEIMVPAADATKLFAAIHQAGAEFELANVGLHALNSLRLEKGFRHWGHDIASEDNLLQAGLSFTAKPDAKDFIGKQAFLQQKSAGLPERRLVQFKLHNPEPLLYHNEPILMNGDYVGYLTSGMYGHAVGAAIGMGYVNIPNLSKDAIATANFSIEVAQQHCPAQASLQGFYDPAGERMKG
ncbi:MAG: FAD-dependent oxidoreductase [Gammaproteobacteria bacterium]|nr:FAD-dependent oxidoreductase [Gammaproteobacteria bacterium]